MPGVDLTLLLAIALVLGVRHGLYDARAGRPPLPAPGRFAATTLTPLLVSLAFVSGYRYLTLHRIRPSSAVFGAALVAWIPFVLARALTNHLVTRAAVKNA
jgi:uncharacterized BrkB/YihY/UPF0761 family membrane protein